MTGRQIKPIRTNLRFVQTKSMCIPFGIMQTKPISTLSNQTNVYRLIVWQYSALNNGKCMKYNANQKKQEIPSSSRTMKSPGIWCFHLPKQSWIAINSACRRQRYQCCHEFDRQISKKNMAMYVLKAILNFCEDIWENTSQLIFDDGSNSWIFVGIMHGRRRSSNVRERWYYRN